MTLFSALEYTIGRDEVAVCYGELVLSTASLLRLGSITYSISKAIHDEGRHPIGATLVLLN